MAGEAQLKDVLEAAGRSLADAQGALTGEPSGGSLAISTAELEMKTTVVARDGQLAVEPLSTATVLRGGIDSGLISTVRVNYVAVQAAPQPPATAKRTAAEVASEIRKQPDFTRLAKAYGELTVKAYYVADVRRWVAQVSDGSGRVVREQLLPDDAGGK